MQNKTILLVNTGASNITGAEHKKFIIKAISNLGVNVVALNDEENLKSKCISHWILSDLQNSDKTLKKIEEFLAAHPDVRIDGALTFYEDSVLLVSKIVDKLGLVGVPYVTADLVRNKYKFREFCRKNGLPAPKYQIIRGESDLKKVRDELAFPIVLKPTYGASSAFVVKVETKADLSNTYHYIKTNASQKIESALDQNLEVIAEEYIDGDEVDINILVQNGRVKFFNITDNYHTNEPFFIETGMAEPSALPDVAQKALIDMADEVLDVLRVQNACVQFEAKSTSDGPVPLEVNLRMGGDEAYFFAKKAWGVDMIEGAVKIAVGEHIQKIEKGEPRVYLAGETLHAQHSGVVSRVDVDPELEKKDYLENVEIFKEIGDSILVPPFGYEYVGWVAATGENPVDADENLQSALKMVDYSVVKFDEASCVGKTTRKERHHDAVFTSRNIVGGEKIKKIRVISPEDQRKLHIGIACNDYHSQNANIIEKYIADAGRQVEKTLKDIGYRVSYFDFNKPMKAISDISKSHVDFIFNMCERINNTSFLEPHAASVFDILQIPYTGSNPSTLGFCMDKIKVKKLLTYHDIPTPAWDYVYDVEEEISDELEYPLIVKPSNTDNSIGITNESVVTNRDELKKRVKYVIEELGSPALIEEYIDGDEYDVYIMGNEKNNFRVLPLSRTIFSNLPKDYWHIKTLESKFGQDKTYLDKVVVQIPPKKVNPKLISLLSEICLDTYNILDCHDYGKVEVRVDKHNNPYVLELNANPSISAKDIMNFSIEDNSFDYGEFLEWIIGYAIERYKNRPPYYHLQSNII